MYRVITLWIKVIYIPNNNVSDVVLYTSKANFFDKLNRL